jgi:hypothetical protein
MENILNTLDSLNFLKAMWLFPVAFAIHEAEEWNIMKWYYRNYTNLPPSSNRGARTWIIFVSLIGFIWCGIAVLSGNPTVAAFVFLPAIAFAIQNSFQHIIWTFYFKQYAPGIITSIFLLIPIGSYLIIRAIQHGYVPIWYATIWSVFIVIGLVQTIRAGNQMTPPIRAIHHLGNKLSDMIFGS